MNLIDAASITAVVLHGPFDILVTLAFWSHESNPLVSSLGIQSWLIVKAMLLIGLAVGLTISHEQRATQYMVGTLAVLGVVFILPNPFIALV